MRTATRMIEALRQRDRRVQQELRDRLFPRILAVCLSMLKDRTLAEECAEDVWMDFIYDHIDKVKKEGALGAYLRMMTVRRCVRIRQWSDRHEEPGDQAPFVSGSEEALVAGLDERRRAGRLQACMQRLSKKVRRMLRMRYHNDMTQEAIGKALGVSKQYTGRVLAKSLEKLRECMQEGT